jgi:prepilin-type N-terminal cleavage/methylation domain-containing protein
MKSRPAPSIRIVLRLSPEDHRSGGRGFTLIEITIILMIIGILAVLAINSYRMMVNKARMTQAKIALNHLTKTETIYFSDHDRYTDNITLLDFDPVKYNYYEISVALDNDAQDFTGTATGVGIMAGDRWYVTKGGDPFQDNTSPFK